MNCNILFFLFLFSVLEISTHDYGPHNERLTAKMLNGLNENYRTNTQSSAYNYSLQTAGNFSALFFILSVNFKIDQNKMLNQYFKSQFSKRVEPKL